MMEHIIDDVALKVLLHRNIITNMINSYILVTKDPPIDPGRRGKSSLLDVPGRMRERRDGAMGGLVASVVIFDGG